MCYVNSSGAVIALAVAVEINVYAAHAETALVALAVPVIVGMLYLHIGTALVALTVALCINMRDSNICFVLVALTVAVSINVLTGALFALIADTVFIGINVLGAFVIGLRVVTEDSVHEIGNAVNDTAHSTLNLIYNAVNGVAGCKGKHKGENHNEN